MAIIIIIFIIVKSFETIGAATIEAKFLLAVSSSKTTLVFTVIRIG